MLIKLEVKLVEHNKHLPNVITKKSYKWLNKKERVKKADLS